MNSSINFAMIAWLAVVVRMDPATTNPFSMGKIKTIKMIRITQEDDRNITMKIFTNSKPGKIV